MPTSSTSFNSTNVPPRSRPTSRPAGTEPLDPIDDFVEYVSTYARQNPGTTALWCFGVGFIIGWKLKPW